MKEDAPSSLKLQDILALLFYIGYSTALTYLLLTNQFPVEFSQSQDILKSPQQEAPPKYQFVPKPFENFFPNRNRFVFDDFIFDSDFDGGNLNTLKKVRHNHYELTESCDGQGTEYEISHKKGLFYFKIVVLKQISQPEVVKFSAVNCSFMQKRNVFHGLVPVYRTLPNHPDWRYLDTPLEGVSTLNRTLSFSFDIPINPGDKELYVATFIPYNYTDVYTILDKLETQAKTIPEMYFRRDVLTNSLQGRPIEMVSITHLENQTPKAEQTNKFEKYAEGEILGKLFPSIYYNYFNTMETCESNGSWLLPPPEFPDKKVIIISSRVHPGEAPASHIMDGVLLKLFESFNDRETRAFLDQVVVLLIPMLNPDGVTHSYFRTDMRAKDLNRAYAEEDQEAYPANYAIKRLIDYYAETDRFYMFVDLHAHVNLDGFFVYSNSAKNPEDYRDLRAFFDEMMDQCENFMPEQSMFSHKAAPNEFGKARLHLKKTKNLKYVYTIESGYFKGRPLYQRRRNTAEKDGRPRMHADKLYLEDFREIGRCIAQSIMRSWVRIGHKSPYYSGSEY